VPNEKDRKFLDDIIYGDLALGKVTLTLKELIREP